MAVTIILIYFWERFTKLWRNVFIYSESNVLNLDLAKPQLGCAT